MNNPKIADQETRTSATENIPDNLLTPVEPTLVANMERIVELAIELKLNDTFYSPDFDNGSPKMTLLWQ